MQINIEERFEICKELYKGIFPANPRGLFVNESNDEFSEADVKKLISREGTSEVMSTPKRLIEKLSAEDVDEKLIETLPASDTKRLIQEVNSNADGKIDASLFFEILFCCSRTVQRKNKFVFRFSAAVVNLYFEHGVKSFSDCSNTPVLQTTRQNFLCPRSHSCDIAFGIQ